MSTNSDILTDLKSYEPVTEEEIKARDLMEARAEEIGISLTTYDGEEDDSAYKNPVFTRLRGLCPHPASRIRFGGKDTKLRTLPRNFIQSSARSSESVLWV